MPAWPGFRRGHTQTGRSKPLLVGIRRMRGLHGGQLLLLRQAQEGRRFHARGEGGEEAGPGVHRLRQSDKEVREGEADSSGRGGGEPEEDRPLRRVDGLHPQEHPLRRQGGHRNLRHGGAGEPRVGAAHEGGGGLAGRPRDMLRREGDPRGAHRDTVVRGVRRGPAQVLRGVPRVLPQLRPHHGQGDRAAPRPEGADPEPAAEAPHRRGARLRPHVRLRVRRAPLLREGRQGPGHGHHQELHNVAPRLLRRVASAPSAPSPSIRAGRWSPAPKIP